ncbi:MAG: glycosyltransferase [Bacteroidota bacterium]
MKFIPTFEYSEETILFFSFAAIAFVHLLYVLLLLRKLAFFKEKKTLEISALPPITVIIAARNESDNLFENLPFILQQNYPEFEVIVINNQSIDDSFYLLKAYQQQYPNLRFIEVEKSKHLRQGKKLPITLGIKGAKYDHLVLTDADCRPMSYNWLTSMASRYTPETELILGYGPYQKKNTFLNRLVRFDTSFIASNYFSFALAKLSYMGVGRNLAYTKELFFKVHGFKSHYSLPSGDDDLFVQQVMTRKNVRIDIEPSSFCFSEAPESFGAWVRQKTRHYSTSKQYNVIKKALLGIYPLTLILMLISFVILLFSSDFRWLTTSVFALVLVIKWWIQGKGLVKLGEKKLANFFPFWDILYAFLIPILFFSVEKKQNNRW